MQNNSISLSHAKELADIYKNAGYEEVTASAGVHHGTFKVYVNFIPVADITQLTPELFKAVKEEAITVNGILYEGETVILLESINGKLRCKDRTGKIWFIEKNNLKKIN